MDHVWTSAHADHELCVQHFEMTKPKSDPDSDVFCFDDKMWKMIKKQIVI